MSAIQKQHENVLFVSKKIFHRLFAQRVLRKGRRSCAIRLSPLVFRSVPLSKRGTASAEIYTFSTRRRNQNRHNKIHRSAGLMRTVSKKYLVCPYDVCQRQDPVYQTHTTPWKSIQSRQSHQIICERRQTKRTSRKSESVGIDQAMR